MLPLRLLRGIAGASAQAAALDFQNLADSSANNRGLTLGGRVVPSFASDPFGIGQAGMTFGASIQAAAPGALFNPPAGDWTFEFRFRRTTANNGATQILFGRWATLNGANNFQYLCFFDSGNKLNFIQSAAASGSPVGIVDSGASGITDGNAHVCRVVYASGNLYMYIDGTRVAGPTAIAAPATIPAEVPFLVGNYGDFVSSAFTVPSLYGQLGDFRFSDVARSTGASYTVPSTPLTSDANTLALLPMSGLSGSYLTAPAFSSTALRRTGYTQASGGWANPDGPLPMSGGGFYFTVSAYNGSLWTCYAVTAPTLSALLGGTGTVGPAAIQTPSGADGDLAANGSVVYFGGTYHHIYQGNNAGVPQIRRSSGASLGAPFSPQPGTLVFASGYSDPWVRVSPDGTTLVMYMRGASNNALYVTTSTDVANWTAPAVVSSEYRQLGSGGAPGEPAVDTSIPGTHYYGWADGATTGTARNLVRFGIRDGAYMPLGLSITPSGSDSGSVPYTACFDGSPYFDAATSTYYVLAAHSTNTNITQPTDSDIGVWSFSLVRAAPAAPSNPNAIGLDGAALGLNGQTLELTA